MVQFYLVNFIFNLFSQVYYQLENLNKGDTPYKSIAALNCVIVGCANIWDVDRAYLTFSSIESTFGLTPDIHSYNGLLCAFGKLGKVNFNFNGISLGSRSFFSFL